MMESTNEELIGARIRNLRQRSRISLRELARRAGIAVSYLSSLEKDQVSPTLATLRKVLLALGTNYAEFFSGKEDGESRYVFRHHTMRQMNDQDREYTFVLPSREDIHVEIMDEHYHSGTKTPSFETMDGNFVGYVVEGMLTVEIDNMPPAELFGGDAFHVPAGMPLRGYCRQGKNARVITVLYNRAEEGIKNRDA